MYREGREDDLIKLISEKEIPKNPPTQRLQARIKVVINTLKEKTNSRLIHSHLYLWLITRHSQALEVWSVIFIHVCIQAALIF